VLDLPAGPRARFEAVAARVGGRVSRARFGNFMLSGGYDVVFECIGRPRTLEESLKWTRPGGQTVMVGTGHGRGTDLTAVWFGELSVLGISGRGQEDFRGRKVHTYRLVHELMLASEAEVSRLVTHTFALKDYKAALAAAMDKAAHKSLKVAFEFPP
jgi:L-iditol 2-dehydrogenase